TTPALQNPALQNHASQHHVVAGLDFARK
ncbi:MAG: hypothetical protein RL591_1586, partial [Planctomycetota bacterium]